MAPNPNGVSETILFHIALDLMYEKEFFLENKINNIAWFNTK